MRIKPDKIKSRDISAVTEHISKLTKNVVNFCEKKKTNNKKREENH